MIATFLRTVILLVVGGTCMLVDTIRPHRTKPSSHLHWRCNGCRRPVRPDRIYTEGALGLRHFRRGRRYARSCGPVVPSLQPRRDLRLVEGVRW